MINAQAASQYWKQLDLPSLQKELDEKATDLANRQDESEASRKKLVDMCRDFKKSLPEDAKRLVTPVLKCFQSEIDSLSKRSKAAEAAFLSLYKKIIESPDPAPLLESAAQSQKKAQKVQDLEIENANLKETLNQYNLEFAEIKNQEITIRQLKEKIKTFEDQMETIIAAKLLERESVLLKNMGEKERRLALSESLLQSKLSEVENRAESLEKSLNAAQQELFQLKSHSDELGSARSSEIELLMSDLEKTNLRAAAAERECEKLRGNAHSVKEEQDLENLLIKPENNSALDIELALKDRQMSQLLDELTQIKAEAEADKLEKNRRIEELNEELGQKMCLIEDMQDKMDKHADYDECKRELAVLKSVYLGAEDETIIESTNVASNPKNLELLLLEKNKALQLEKTAILNKKRELENFRRRAARAKLAALRKAPSPSQAAKNRSLLAINLASLAPNSSLIAKKCLSTPLEPHCGVPPPSSRSDDISGDALVTWPEAVASTSNTICTKSSTNGAAGAKLNNAVERMACLIGSELVSKYDDSNKRRIASATSINRARLLSLASGVRTVTTTAGKRAASAVLSRVKKGARQRRDALAAATAFANAGITPSSSSCVGNADDDAGTFDNIDDALNAGVPREIIECIAIQHLQQNLNKRLLESPVSMAAVASSSSTQEQLPAPMDTSAVAARCRQVLADYNIGQRLLAKCVLNQSQGAVSELLSKPKSWYRLTEKGKESFRRIEAWLSDEPSISILRMISPKRAYGGFRERYPVRAESDETQRRITAILAAAREAQKRVRTQAALCVAACIKPAVDCKISPKPSGERSAKSVTSASPAITAEKSESVSEFATSMTKSLKFVVPTSTPSSNEICVSSAALLSSTAGSKINDTLSTSTAGQRASLSSSGGRSRSNRVPSGRYRHDDIPKEMVYEIYKRELAKLREQQHIFTKCHSNVIQGLNKSIAEMKPAALTTTSPLPKATTTLAASKASCSATTKTPSRNRRKSVHVSRISPSRLSAAIAGDENLLAGDENSFAANDSTAFDVDDPSVSNAKIAAAPSFDCTAHSNDGSSVAEYSNDAEIDSERHQANSAVFNLMSNLNGNGPNAVKTTKALLTPITQEQFDIYGVINTEELVKEIKEYLCEHSISQRLFGEQVLGLSQGSVSDLLARPKSWASLTQKGREPFVRMQMFVEDKRAASSSHRIERKQPQSSTTQCDSSIVRPKSSVASNDDGDAGDDASSVDDRDSTSTSFWLDDAKLAAACVIEPATSADNADAAPTTTTTTMTPTATAAISPADLAWFYERPALLVSAEQVKAKQKQLLETSARLDTAVLVRRVKECLLNNNIAQKIFGQAVLGMSQGAVSDLLSKCKDWSLLSYKGKEAFVRMQIWLDDPEKVEKLIKFRSDRNALCRPSAAFTASTPGLDARIETLLKNATAQSALNLKSAAARVRRVKRPFSPPSGGHLSKNAANNVVNGDSAGSFAASSAKKPRLFLSDEQRDTLRNAYDLNPYPNPHFVLDLAKQLKVNMRTIYNWFHNKRMRIKAQMRRGGGGAAGIFRSQLRACNLSSKGSKLSPDEPIIGVDVTDGVSSIESDLNDLLLVLQGHQETLHQAADPVTNASHSVVPSSPKSINGEVRTQLVTNDDSVSQQTRDDVTKACDDVNRARDDVTSAASRKVGASADRISSFDDDSGENNKSRTALIDRLQSGIGSAGESWDAEEDRRAAMDRIESHVLNGEGADWEF